MEGRGRRPGAPGARGGPRMRAWPGGRTFPGWTWLSSVAKSVPARLPSPLAYSLKIRAGGPRPPRKCVPALREDPLTQSGRNCTPVKQVFICVSLPPSHLPASWRRGLSSHWPSLCGHLLTVKPVHPASSQLGSLASAQQREGLTP